MQVKFNQVLFGYKVCGPYPKFFSKHLLVGGYIESLGITRDIWLISRHKMGDNDIIQLFYRILLTIRSLKKLNNYCNISKKGFTTLGVIQLMEPIAIIHTPSLFDPLKTIDAAFFIGLYSFDIECQFFLQNLFLILAHLNVTPIFV